MIRIIGHFTFVLLLFSLVLDAGEAQDESGIRYEALTDIATVDIGYDRFELSPSGTLLAYLTREELCIYEIDAQILDCSSLPWQDGYTASYNSLGSLYLEWSPNEQYIAFAKYPFVDLPWDTDIWLYNIDLQEYHNLTDDGIATYYISSSASATGLEIFYVPIDFLPMWEASSQYIYFFRAYPEETGRWFNEFGLYRFSLADNSVQYIYDFSNDFKPPVYAASFSPDETKIAMVVGGRGVNEDSTGIWILHLRQFTLEYAFAPDSLLGIVLDQVNDLGFSDFSGIAWHYDNQLYTVAQGYDIDADTRSANFRDLFFAITLEPSSVQLLNFPLAVSTVNTSSVFISNQIELEFIIVAEPDNQLQKLYYGNNQDGFQLIEELPYYGSQYNNRIIQIAENHRVLSGGLLIELPIRERIGQ